MNDGHVVSRVSARGDSANRCGGRRVQWPNLAHPVLKRQPDVAKCVSRQGPSNGGEPAPWAWPTRKHQPGAFRPARRPIDCIRTLRILAGLAAWLVVIEPLGFTTKRQDDAMIEQLTNFPDQVVGFRCSGRVTKEDYEKVLAPAVLAGLQANRTLRLYYETGKDFTLDAGAMWEDFKIGIDHLMRWDRIAVVTDIEWIRTAVRLFAFMMPATTRVFSLSEAAEAHAWIAA
ncbi:STAS/SEC14 domain-containing protein [Bradyrhizobium oligotrophicum S58]